MEYRILGCSGVRVSRLCLGSMMFGGPTDAATSARMIATAKEAGFNFLDTADVYSRGASEEEVGQALAGSRQQRDILRCSMALPMNCSRLFNRRGRLERDALRRNRRKR